MDSYGHYTEGPRGSPELWAAAARLLASKENNTEDLKTLGLSELPSSKEELKKIWRNVMTTAHPDKGGTHEQAMAINEAYERLQCRFASLAVGKMPIDLSRYVEPTKAEHIEHKNFDNLWIDPKYINENHIADKKLNGWKGMFYIEELSELLSKGISKVTGVYVDKTLNCPHITRVMIPKKFWGTVLEGELINPNSEDPESVTLIMGCDPEEAVERQKKFGWLEYHVYDVSKISGVDIRHLPLKERKARLAILINQLKKYIPIILHPYVPATEAKSLYEEMVAKKKEGIMLKDLCSPYGEGIWKVKHTVTFDVVIMGYQDPKKTSKKKDGTVSVTSLYKEGLIGSIVFGAYKNGNLVELGTCSGMTKTRRKELSKNKEKYIGTVIEIKFQDRTKSGAFRHARYIRPRPDKSAEQCIDLV